MNKFAKIGAGLLGAVTVIGLAMPAFALDSGSKGALVGKSSGNKTHSGKAAVTATFDVTKMGCVGTAVGKREDAVDAAFSAFSASESAALATKKDGLGAAYSSSTTAASLKTAVKAAWKAFRDSKTTARKTFSDTRTQAWTTFKMDVKACGASALENSADAGSEISK